MSLRYFCCDERRRSAVAGHATLNGIDFLEVLDHPSMPSEDRQRTLFVHFIKDPTGLALSPSNLIIEGGEREEYRDPSIRSAQIALDPRSESTDPVLAVEVAQRGDFSIYTLRLVADESDPHLLDGLDPMLRAVDFSFKANCKSGFDCADSGICPAEPVREPAINYLARDYNSFRQLMLDRLSVLMPAWRERSPADAGIALVELLAYVGDYLSYRQDAIATEAYLDTARRRVSVRRHARLVDYQMHDGCNARAWVHVRVDADLTLARGTQFFTALPDLPDRIAPDAADYRRAIGLGVEVFEACHDATLFSELNRLEFYTWGARECCLPKGATRATLRGRLLNLAAGAILVFEEVRSPGTGDPDDADPRHRHAVRLVDVRVDDPVTGARLRDPIGGQFAVPPVDSAVDVTEIVWADEDALPFALCISAESDEAYGGGYVEQVSIALGNILLADHGRSIGGEDLGEVPQPPVERLPNPQRALHAGVAASAHCRARDLETVPPRFRPMLTHGPLTQALPYDEADPPPSAYAATHWNMDDVRPAIHLNGGAWRPQRDLLNSGNRQEFVVETEADGRSWLRFGDGSHGAALAPGITFTADYRVGNGVRGNVGADTLVHVVSSDSAVLRVRNPLPARGAQNMESIKQVRETAPRAFRRQRRAVTPKDYADRTTEHPGAQRSQARLRWTGSWHTMFVAVDRVGGARLDAPYETQLRQHLEPFRMAGHDLEIDHPRMVALEIAMLVDVHPDYERSHVRTDLLRLFSSRELPDGRRGVFHPDKLSFGQTVYLSPIYAAAQALDGVEAVDITLFQRQDMPDQSGLDSGKLPMGRFEIPRLDNDPNFPGRGVLQLTLRGGR